MERDVSRAGTRAHDPVASFNVMQRFAIEIEPVDEHAVGAEVCGEREAVGGIGDDAVGVRLALTIGNRSVASVLHDGCGGRKRSVRLNRKQRDAAAIVVGDEYGTAAAVDAQVARRTTLRRLLALSSEGAGVARDREGADRTRR